MSEALKAGVIGCGAMGEQHARLYAETRKSRLVAVMDPDESRARAIAQRYDCSYYGDLESFARANLDVVSICADDRHHVEPAVTMAGRGAHLLIEKPLATTAGDCDTIIEAAEQAGVKLMVGHCVRFDPRYHAAYTAICRGELGEISHAYARRTNLLDAAKRIGGRVELPLFLGVHDIDILRWLVGSEIRSVSAVASRKILASMGVDVADAYYATFRFESGAVGCLELAWTTPEGLGFSLDAVCHVTGSRGTARVEVCGEGYVQASRGEVTGGGVTYGYEVTGRLRGALHSQTAHFLDCVNDDAEPLISAEDAKRAVVVAEAMMESARAGVVVAV